MYLINTSFINISFCSFDKFLAVSNFAKCCSMSNFICMLTLYRPQFWPNSLQIFFSDRYWLPDEVIEIWKQLDYGIRSKKIPENPKNPYLSSLRKFQKFISPPKMIRMDSFSLETFVGSISTLKKNLTLKGQTSRSWQGKMCSNFNALYLKNY